MKNLKIKFGLFSLLAIITISVFLTSCEQETVITDQTSNEIQEMMLRMIQDTDVSTFIDAALEYDKEMKNRIEANQEQFDTYSLANDNDKINELIKLDEISGLIDQMLATASVVSAKFPQIDAIDEDVIEKFRLNNPQIVEIVNSQSTELELRNDCNSGYWNNLRHSWCVALCVYAYLQSSLVDWNGYQNCSDNCYRTYCNG